ncbi:hypothetical protein B0H19DRAFT_1256899 [Mycena capillaripes]|nr:hypothetical protein B0H19DRAFT_1256899 [Mycena capillaripes]
MLTAVADDAMPARLSPFSLAEFRALVSAALDSDAPAPALSLSLSSAAPPSISFISNLQRKKSLPNLPHAPPSRMRLLITKLKKRVAAASALVKRRRSYKAPVGVRAAAVLGEPDRSSSSGVSLSPFTRYISLAVQYERAAPSESAFFAPSPSPASYESACTSESSHSHAPPPPSPTASSFSDASASFYPHPSFPVSPYYSDAHRPYSFAAEAEVGYNAAEDPFAKDAVRVVHHSCEALWLRGSAAHSLSYSTSLSPSRVRRGRRRVQRVEVEAEVDDSGVYLQEEQESYADREEGEEEWKLPTPPPSPSHATPVPPPASLARAPTARSYPLSSAPRLRRTKRPGSPFPLPLMRSATSA